MRKITNEELHRPTAEQFAQMKRIPVVVVLDNVRSAHNIGAFFRTGDAFAVESIALWPYDAEAGRTVYSCRAAKRATRWQGLW